MLRAEILRWYSISCCDLKRWTPNSPPLKMLLIYDLFSCILQESHLSPIFSLTFDLWSSNISSQERISDSFWSHSRFPLFLSVRVLPLIWSFVFSSFFSHVFALLCLVSLFCWNIVGTQQEKHCHREKSSLSVVLLKHHTAYSTRALLWSERKIERGREFTESEWDKKIDMLK